MLAVQGPHARAIVAARARRRAAAADAGRRRSQIGRRPALVCGTGYTGEDGVELLLDPEVAPPIWAELLDAGVVPCGLGARDTLRLEVCFHLHGNDLTPGAQPDRGRPRLVLQGGDRLHRLRGGRRAPAPRAPPRSWSPFKIEGAGHPARRATRSSPAARTVGAVTSGTFSPSLEVGIGMAYVRADLAEPGTEVEIDVRGKRRAARIASKPLYAESES